MNSPALSMKQTPPFSFIPLPFKSPRPLACKRPLETELQNFDLSFAIPCDQESIEGPPAKRQIVEFPRDVEVYEEIACPATPEKRACKSIDLEFTPEEFKPVTPSVLPRAAPEASEKLLELAPEPSLDAAVAASMNLFKEALTVYVLERDRQGLDDPTKADQFIERWAADHYEELRDAMLSLLPWTGELKSAPGGAYDLLEFQGRRTPQKKISARQLEHFRSEGAQARAWEALCALLAVISSREQLVWLDYNIYLDRDIPKWLAEAGLGNSRRGGTKRVAAIRDMVPRFMEEGAGGFAKSLIDPRGLHCVTLARSPSGPLPATSTTTRRMPLWDALKCMDDEGPFRKGPAAEKEWCWGAGRQFALQDLEFGHTAQELVDEPRKGRKAAKDLVADPRLRDLLRSKRPVRLLDTLAALAPRDTCKEHGLGKIVTTELQRLLLEAKAAGEAVVFHLGGDSPHKLAEKVYLRPPLADNGMRCGCLRWRENADVPWARESCLEDRIILCLQMP